MSDWRRATVLEAAEDMGCSWAHEYVEPGYHAGEDSPGILFGNWNPKRFDKSRAEQDRDPGPQLARVAERLGFSIEWEDEWCTCGSCGRAFRTEPSHYGWVPSYKYWEGEVTCRECLMEDPEGYVDAWLLNNAEQADTFGVDLAALGFRELESGESGFHPGQNDTPAEMAKQCPEGFDFAFQIDGVGQFDMRFSLWIRPEGWEG